MAAIAEERATDVIKAQQEAANRNLSEGRANYPHSTRTLHFVSAVLQRLFISNPVFYVFVELCKMQSLCVMMVF